MYVAGSLNNNAAYWKNGVTTTFSNNGELTGIAVSGANIYLSGTILSPLNNGGFPTYWKNGIQSPLAPGNGFASALTLNGTDIYIAGATYTPTPGSGDVNSKFYYWKNGNAVLLNSGNSRIINISKIVVAPR